MLYNLRPVANTAQLTDWATTPAQFDQMRQENLVFGNARFTNVMYQELCIQRQSEADWEQLVRQMVPNCIAANRVFGNNGVLRQVIDQAMAAVINGVAPANLDTRCGAFAPDIPADFETSLDAIVFNHGRAGQGRP
jgi:hypothetical protein